MRIWKSSQYLARVQSHRKDIDIVQPNQTFKISWLINLCNSQFNHPQGYVGEVMPCYAVFHWLGPNLDFTERGQTWRRNGGRKVQLRCWSSLPRTFVKTPQFTDSLTGFCLVRKTTLKRQLPQIKYGYFWLLLGHGITSYLEKLFWVVIVICGFSCALLLLRSNIEHWTENPLSESQLNFPIHPDMK